VHLAPFKSLHEVSTNSGDDHTNDAVNAAVLAERLCRDRIDLVPALGVIGRWSVNQQHDAVRQLVSARDDFADARAFWRR
jgi:hypothetical protein